MDKKDSKICNKCSIDKKYTSYYRKSESVDGYETICKDCRKKSKSEYYQKNKGDIKERNRKWKLDNKEKNNANNKEWYEKNKDVILEKKKKYRKEKSEYLSKKSKEYEKKYRKKRNDKFKERMKNDSVFRLKRTVKCLIYDSFRKNNFSKNGVTESIIGITFKDFKDYIESLFKEGMTWENHGEWHLDHIIPISSAKTPEDVVKLNNYTNFQPLWAIDNLRKSNKI